MLYLALFLLGCLVLALLPPGTWTRQSSFAVVAAFYGLVLAWARGSRAAAWQQKVVVGAEAVWHYPSEDRFVPTYQGEQTWQWVLVGLPVLAWTCWYCIDRPRNAALRRALAWLYFPYAVLVLYGTEHNGFPGPQLKPEFRDAELTIPYR